MESVTVLVLAVALALVALGWWLREKDRKSANAKQEQFQFACEEARTIVDLITPAAASSTLPDTVALSALVKRIHHLDARLRRLAASELSARVAEATEDVRRVASSLAAALDAERSLRFGSPKDPGHRAYSAERIAERSTELDAAADELRWLVETED